MLAEDRRASRAVHLAQDREAERAQTVQSTPQRHLKEELQEARLQL